MDLIHIGLIGAGTVGGGTYKALTEKADVLTARTGIKMVVKRVAVKAFDEPRAVYIPDDLLTTDWKEVACDPEIDIVVELMGGINIAKTVVLTALRQGKSVVTANKALLSFCGEELFAEAEAHHTNLYYEASVGGGIPLIKTIRESLVCNSFQSIYGIVNGTCNYILTRMKQEGADFETVLKDAQKQGYAEANAGLDVDGHDAHHKTSILASLAHNMWVDSKYIYLQGIRDVTVQDMEFAEKLGYSIKLLGNIQSVDGKIQAAVSPTLVPGSHLLAGVNDVFNAVWVRGDVVGDTMFYGRGAGQDATASAVVGDVVDAAINIKDENNRRIPAMSFFEKKLQIAEQEEFVSKYYVRLQASGNVITDAEIVFCDQLKSASLGIEKSLKDSAGNGKDSSAVIITAKTTLGNIQKMLKDLRESFKDVKVTLFLVEDFEG